MDAPEELPSQEFDLAPDEADLRISQVLSGRYRIDAVLSKGGLGTVYRGEHVHMRKQMAVKVLHPETKENPHLVARFEREAIAGAHIHHENVAAATDFGQLEDGTFFLVMEFVHGRPLHEIIRSARLPQRRAAHIARQIAAGLAASHGVGIAHRDLKPANVMIAEGTEDLVKLIDFGFARIDFNRLSLPGSDAPGKPEPPNLTTGTMIFGTPAYMAPETVGGMAAVDYRSDLYALGVMMFEMLTGERPFDDREVVRLLRRKNQEPAPRMSDRLGDNVVADALESIVARLLERDPNRRFPSAAEAREAIEAVMDDLPTGVLRQPSHVSDAEIELGPTQVLVQPAQDQTPAATHSSVAPKRSRVASRTGLGVMLTAAATGIAGLVWYATRPSDRPTLQAISAASSYPIVEASSVASAPPSSPGPPATLSATAAASSAPAQRSGRASELMAEVWKAYAQKKWKVGAQELLALIAEDPTVFEHPDMVQAAASVAVGADNVDTPLARRLIDALGSAKDPGSVDVLYQIVRSTGVTRRPGKLAAQWLGREQVLQRATPAARVAIELRLAGCAQKRPLFARAAAQGDDRALSELQALFAMRCGRRSPGPCCFKRDGALSEALSALSARIQQK